MRYVGVDISKRKCRVAIVDEDGLLVDEFSFSNNFLGISSFLSRLSFGDRVVMESTGNLWVNMYDALEERAFCVVLANPLKMKAIASAKIKSDKVDARTLAYLLRAGLVAESYVPPRELRDLRAIRALARYRASLVGTRTAIKNRVHSLLDRYGLRHGFSDLFGKAGLAPSLYQSGSVERHGCIIKQGSRMLRWIMVEAARTAVRHDARLRDFYERVRRRRGDGKAVAAVAAKMLKIIWFMLTRGGSYQSRDVGLYGRKLKLLG